MQARRPRLRWWLRGCALAAPVGVAVAGCTGGPQLNYLNGSVNGMAANAARMQKPDEVVPASSVALPPTTLADGIVAVRAVAYVNNAPVFESEWRDAINQRARELADLREPQLSQKRRQIEQQELDRLIERELIVETALAHMKKMKSKVMEEMQREGGKEFDRRLREIKSQFNVQSDEQLKELFASQGMTIDSLRRQVERSFISMEYMRNLIFPKIQTISLAEIRDYYEQHGEEFQEHDRLKWQALFVDASKLPNRPAAQQYADQVATQLRAGADFAAVAKKLHDSGVNILLADAGVGEKRGEIQPTEVEAALFQLRQNEISSPVELPGGFYVMRVTERTYAGRKPLDVATQSEIRRKLTNLFADREYRRMVEEMKAKAVIQKVASP